MLHFAGGNCYSFQFLAPFLKDFDVIPLELPGRGRRIREDLLNNFAMAADDIFRQMCSKLDSRDFLIYGHSMGAYLALHVSQMLEKAGKTPVCLIVSGNAGPGIQGDKKRYLLDKQSFIDELKHLGGISTELLEYEEFFNVFEPVLRADFEIAERDELDDEVPVNAPLYALMGSLEERKDKISNWGKFTRSDFKYDILEGDHFFIHHHPRKIAQIIRGWYEKSIDTISARQ